MDVALDKFDKIVTKLTITRLKDLIKSIRNCKTAADERAVIAKASASIRTAFKEDNADTRHINVAKLLYIHMLGYPAHFGQIECLKLVASPRYADKKLGYLGIMLLLDESQEVLTLVTNCLKNDMNNANVFVVGLALCTMANIGSAEMSRDLCGEVERLLGSSNAYIRKKAALAALRIIKKTPELAENFIQRSQTLLTEKNHGVLLTGVTLLIGMTTVSQELITELRKRVPDLVRLLKNLSSSGYSPEHDVNGISDPFLQVKVLKLLRILGKSDAEASDQMNDVLAQVATNTDSSKNVGNAILYESVLTIMDIEADSSLRVMAINILGKFLTNKDNNVRYVSLTTLGKVSIADASALQRHRATILECLHDSDISIRRRALDLAFILINHQNIRILTRELLSFLEVCEPDIKGSVGSRICQVAGKFRPNKRWEIDTVTRVLKVSGKYVDQFVVNYFIKLVTTGPELYSYSVKKLFFILNSDRNSFEQEALVLAGLWLVGEYGELLLTTDSLQLEHDEDAEDSNNGQVSESQIVELTESILKSQYATDHVLEYGIQALIKLEPKLPNSTSSIHRLVSKYTRSTLLELQQRSCEAPVLWSQSNKNSLLARVPPMDSAVKEEAKKGQGIETTASVVNSPKRNQNKGDDIGDLLGGLVIGNEASNNNDLLGNVFGTSPPKTEAVKSAPAADPLALLFGGLSSSTTSTVQTPTPAIVQQTTYTVYSSNNLLITFAPQKLAGGNVDMQVSFRNTGFTAITDLVFQVAVPKTLKLMMQPVSNSTIQPNMTETQALRLENPTKVPIKFRIKLSFNNGAPVSELLEYSSFDASLWS